MTGTLHVIPEPTENPERPPALRVRTPGAPGVLFESTQEGLLLEVYLPASDTVVHIDTAVCTWHALFHLALTGMAEERVAGEAA